MCTGNAQPRGGTAIGRVPKGAKEPSAAAWSAEKGSELDYYILAHLKGAGGPVGSGQLYLSLKEEYRIGQASIGRKLAELDRAALTRKVGFKGRVITYKGLRRLEQLEQRNSRRKKHEDFLELLDARNFSRLIEVLVVRKALESEGVRLAAHKVTAEDIRLMEETLDAQKESLLEGDEAAAAECAVKFHDLIAKASQNEVLRHALNLVASESIFSPYLSQMRMRAGGRLLVDHVEILGHLRARDAEAAAAAMTAHIDGVMRDVARLWGEDGDARNEGGGAQRRR